MWSLLHYICSVLFCSIHFHIHIYTCAYPSFYSQTYMTKLQKSPNLIKYFGMACELRALQAYKPKAEPFSFACRNRAIKTYISVVHSMRKHFTYLDTKPVKSMPSWNFSMQNYFRRWIVVYLICTLIYTYSATFFVQTKSKTKHI